MGQSIPTDMVPEALGLRRRWGLERYVERRRVALHVLPQVEQQFLPTTSEDLVLAVPQVALALLCVRALRVDLAVPFSSVTS
jgi:hypothetical protein